MGYEVKYTTGYETMDELQIYDQHAERHQKAWSAFTQIYILEHPKPQAPRWWQGLPYLMLPFSVIVLAGIALSALRTAPVFLQIALATVGVGLATAEAILAVIVIEVFLVLGRYAWVLMSAQEGEENIGSVKTWMQAGFWIAFAIAVFANLYASVSHLPIIAPYKEAIDLLIALLVGVSAPLLAFISADILGIQWVRSERRRAALKAAFDSAVSEWFAARENSWNARKKDYGLKISVAPTVSNSIPSLSNGSSVGNGATSLPSESTLGHKKAPNATAVVTEYFQNNPDALDGNAVDIAKMLGVGKSTVYIVMGKMKKGAGE